MDVSIVIRTKNEARFIEQTLTKVCQQEFGGTYEIVIVDSGSTDATLRILRNYRVKLVQIPESKFSYGYSLNVGASEANGNFIVNLSAHAFPKDTNWLRSLILGFEEENVAGVYGRQLSCGHVNPFEALQSELYFGPRRIKFDMENRRMVKQIHFSNSNAAVRKDVWQRFHFNEHVSYAEDILWQTGVMEAGFSIVYAPGASVYHTHPVSTFGAYKNAKSCGYALASLSRKRQSVPMVMCDLGIFLILLPKILFQNLSYVLRNKYFHYLKIAPFYVVCGQLGWLAGRIKYRLQW